MDDNEMGWEPIETLPQSTPAMLGAWETRAAGPYWVQEWGHWYPWDGKREWAGWKYSDLPPTHCMRIYPPPMTPSAMEPPRE